MLSNSASALERREMAHLGGWERVMIKVKLKGFLLKLIASTLVLGQAVSWAAETVVTQAAPVPAVELTENATAALNESKEAGMRVRPKRLRDYNLAGLDARVNLKALDSWEVDQLITFLAHRGGLKNVVIGDGVAGLKARIQFDDVSVGEALDVVLSVNNLAYEVRGDIITITTDAEYTRTHGGSFYDNRQVQMVDLKYADAVRVKDMLTPLKSETGTIVADPVTASLILIDTPEKLSEMRTVVARADLDTISRVLPTETKVFNLQYSGVEDVLSTVTAMLTKDVGQIQSDKRTKSLIITDLPHKLAEIEKLIQVFDQRPRQVFIEAKIVSVELGDTFKLGIDWEHLLSGVDPRFSLQSHISPGLAGDAPSAGFAFKTLIPGGGDLNVVLEALKQVGEAKILSNPHVAVMDGQEATLKVVSNEPYVEAQMEAGSTNVTGETYKFVEVGVMLTVTPNINDQDMINMDIRPEVSTAKRENIGRYTVPVVKKAFAETTVMIKSGQTIIIAGLIQDEKSVTDRSVPYVGRIPLLGLLFRSKDELVKTSENIVFLTPRIISGEEPYLRMKDMKKQPKPLRTVGARTTKDLKPVR